MTLYDLDMTFSYQVSRSVASPLNAEQWRSLKACADLTRYASGRTKRRLAPLVTPDDDTSKYDTEPRFCEGKYAW